jgi:hypothetical protein
MGRLQASWQARRGRWWFLAALILVPVVLASTLSVVLLLSLVDAATASDQIELIKTGLAVGAGTGGAVALVLGGRRQWSTEQAQRVTEQSAADSRYDATERRITDLYSKAADQVGSDKAAVRLAGLYSLERLAQDNSALHQTIVNLLCAYLRMPSGDDSRQEFEVRTTAQRILYKHLLPGDDPEHPVATFWPGMDLDLREADLQYFELKDAWLRHGDFGGAKFNGRTWFDGVRFDGHARFGGARFELPASFRSACFGSDARFRGAEFLGAASFDEAVFTAEAEFDGEYRGQPDATRFSDAVSFAGATFAVPPVIDPSVELD